MWLREVGKFAKVAKPANTNFLHLYVRARVGRRRGCCNMRHGGSVRKREDVSVFAAQRPEAPGLTI